jgi:hypothetical protein
MNRHIPHWLILLPALALASLHCGSESADGDASSTLPP